MKSTRTVLQALAAPVLILSLWTSASAFEHTRIEESDCSLLAQAPKISLEDLRAQVEQRLGKVWIKLPGKTAGQATIDFTLSDTGRLTELKVSKSSGLDSFDQSARGSIKLLDPLPKIPAGLGVRSISLRATFHAGKGRWLKVDFAPFGSSGTSPKVAVPPASPSPAAKMPMRSTPPAMKPAATGTTSTRQVMTLNNQAVVAINDSNFKLAIARLEEALRLDPTYKKARDNLAIAYNNYGLSIQDKPAEALRVFHKALALNPGNQGTRRNLHAVILRSGKDPKCFADRVALGDQAVTGGDRAGAAIEYRAALAIKKDPVIETKLARLTGMTGRNLPTKPSPPRPSPPKTGSSRPAAKKVRPPTKQPPVKKPTVRAKPQASKPAVQKAPHKTTAAATSVDKKLDTVYRHISALERKSFGKTFAGDDIVTRLSRLERKVFGRTGTGKLRRRLDALLLMQ